MPEVKNKERARRLLEQSIRETDAKDYKLPGIETQQRDKPMESVPFTIMMLNSRN